MKTWLRRSVVVLLAASACVAPPLMIAAVPDVTGTWVASANTPTGDVEFVFRLKSDANGDLSGSINSPFVDAPILAGSVKGDDIELSVDVDSFGNIQRRTIKARILGDELQFESSELMPAPPPDMAMPGGPGDTGPPLAAPRGPLIARRGTPTPSYRAGPVDYGALPKLQLPALKALPANQLALTPPMGWNSWNKFHTAIDDKTVRGVADALVASGMRDAGYMYVNIDDGWQGTRDSNGVLQPNPNFPDMKALANYVHSKGLKLGIYSSPGPRTCGGFEGSYGHEEIDARTWASWGIDYLKYDWCSAARIWNDADMRAVYQRMGEAIRATGRRIVYSLCQYGRANVESWGPLVGGHLWRTTFDIFDNWPAMIKNIDAQAALSASAAPGRWNDPDMLEVGNGGMTTTEYRTHFSLWAIAAAPLIAGNDVRTLDADTRDILLNKEIIAVNQDRLGKQGRRVVQQGDIDIWLRSLSGGAHALAVVNRGNAEAQVRVNWADLGLPANVGARDLWLHRDLGRLADGYQGSIPAHGVVLLRLTSRK